MPNQVANQDPNTKFNSDELSKNGSKSPEKATGAIALADGTIVYGRGSGATGIAVGELCFNTAITGYQEILTDPSYCDQIVMFTFPHVGNVGANEDDNEESSDNATSAARGAVFRAHPTPPANWRSKDHLGAWLRKKGIVGISGVDTRALTKRIREGGMQKVAIAHAADGQIDKDALLETARAWSGVEGSDLAKTVTSEERFESKEALWDIADGYSNNENAKYHVVVVDFGVKKNILRNLADVGARATVVPATTSADDILALNPDGIVLSNGPGDPAATGEYAAPTIKALIESGKPILGICLGHQMLALSLGAKTKKMAQGHHGANHPVKDLETGKVEIVSMNHGFTVDPDSLPEGVEQSHISLFDGTNSGLRVVGKPIISVQHHPEASPGPQDSFYLFERFAELMN
ncbi:glutamine-hydrolyzing carbamoyl-phosphate synthase small subunit [Hirschia maritima]|uniref:glutamine-hydrolyzing carbamoyl-phosphate synthase small subunit n=1 Tax=Hirschia maritima TaxID=1121961 RepID=UPI00037DFE6F|nr:glutamine-hydrolyzing carbamoyl-phosphate synthase small subunit [Hirschia maritima]